LQLHEIHDNFHDNLSNFSEVVKIEVTRMRTDITINTHGLRNVVQNQSLDTNFHFV